MDDGRPTERMNELLTNLRQAVQDLGSGTLSAEGVERATEEAQALYERFVVMRHKLRERTQVKNEPPVAPPPMPSLKLDTRPAEPPPRQTSLIDAIAESENEGGERKPRPKRQPPPAPTEVPEPAAVPAATAATTTKASLGDQLEHAPIKDLHKAIALSQKFWFVAELFAGQRDRYERTIDAINAASDLPAAMIILTKEAEKDPAKPPAAEVLKVFTELVERRFRT